MLYRNKRRLIIGFSLALLLFLYVFKNYSSGVRAVSVIFGIFVFYFLDHAFHIHFKFRHYLYVLLILVCGILLSPLYYIFESYDKILHFIMPIFGCIMVFYMANRLKTDFKWKLLITVTSVISLLVLLEIGEYLFDQFLGLNWQGVYIRDVTGLQKYNLILDKIDDTMIDLILGIGGCLLFAAGKNGCFFYNKKRKLKKLR